MLEAGSNCDAVLTRPTAVVKALSRAGLRDRRHGSAPILAEAGVGPDDIDVRRMEKLCCALA